MFLLAAVAWRWGTSESARAIILLALAALTIDFF